MRKRLLLGGILFMCVAVAGCATTPPVTGPSTRESAPAAESGYRKAAPTAPIVSKGPKKRVAVVRFQDKSAYGRGRLGSAIQDILITELARSLARTRRAVVYARVGTCQSAFGPLTSWLVEALDCPEGSIVEMRAGTRGASPSLSRYLSIRTLSPLIS